MKKAYFLLFSLGLLCELSAYGVEQKINISGRKDLVLSAEARNVVLNVADAHLGSREDGFSATVPSLLNPFTFKEVAEEASDVAAVSTVRPEVPSEVNVVYDDASVLKVVASSFSKQVRGTLARGNSSYIQLQGGGLLKPGSTFPVRIPEVKDQSFTVTLETINSKGYTLRLGDATLTLSYDDGTSAGPGAVKFNAQ